LCGADRHANADLARPAAHLVGDECVQAEELTSVTTRIDAVA
jgi:hypothetical protein